MYCCHCLKPYDCYENHKTCIALFKRETDWFWESQQYTRLRIASSRQPLSDKTDTYS